VTPLFTIIICTYNRPALLARALESVLAQTLPDFEVVVVDDHSEESIAAIVEAFQDGRLRHLRQPENRGVASSTNLGLATARGDYICILNDDDCYLPDFLERMSRHLHATQADFAWCGFEIADEERPEHYGRVSTATHHQDPWAVTELVTRVGLGTGFTIKRRALEQMGGLDENLRSSEDTELFLRLVQQSWVWQSIPECLVKAYRQQQRLTRPSPQRIQDLIYVMEKHQSFLEATPALKGHFRLALASMYVELGERLKGRREMWSLLKNTPWQIRIWILLIANEIGLGGRLLGAYRALRAWLSRRRSTSV
jgi:glycosyltransferase involved in cell wall biosynthesis